MSKSVSPYPHLDNQTRTPDPPEDDVTHIWFLGTAYPVHEDEEGAYVLLPSAWGEPKEVSVHECAICEELELAGNDVRHLDRSLCNDCADAIMNLKHHRHSGKYVTWPNEPTERERESLRKKISAGRRRKVHERDHYACRYCGARQQLVIDHVHPVSRGGTNEVANLATACTPCNTRKLDRTPEEAGMTLHAPDHFA